MKAKEGGASLRVLLKDFRDDFFQRAVLNADIFNFIAAEQRRQRLRNLRARNSQLQSGRFDIEHGPEVFQFR